MTAPWPQPTRLRHAAFDPAAAVARAFAVLGRNLAGFVLIAALVTSPNSLVAMVRGEHFLWSILAAIVSGTLFYLAQGFIGYAAYQDMIGRPVGAGESLRVAIARFFPLMGLAGGLSVAIGIGFVLLIVPGVLLMVMWSVAVPACIVEGIVPGAGLRRSAALTKGHRLSLLLLLVFLFIAVAIGLAVLDRAFAMAGGGVVAAFGSWIGKALAAAFQAVLATAIYHDLRAAEEASDGPA